MRGGHITQAAVRHVIECSAVQSFVVDSNTAHLRTGQGEGITGGTIAGVFHSHHVTRLQQQLCTKAYRLLRTTGDHNLFSRAGKPARSTQIGGNQLTQLGLPRRITVAQSGRIRIAPESRLQLGPDVERKQIERR
ncbi:hypothetical protein D3C80_1007050 [compost metagenome]